MPKPAEVQPQSIVGLIEDDLFLGKDGIALTPDGSKLNSLLNHQSFLSEVLSMNGTSPMTPEKKRSLILERDQMCRELEIDPSFLDLVGAQFDAIVKKRMPSLKAMRNGNGHSK